MNRHEVARGRASLLYHPGLGRSLEPPSSLLRPCGLHLTTGQPLRERGGRCRWFREMALRASTFELLLRPGLENG